MPLPKEILGEIEAIGLDNLSGAAELSKRGAIALVSLLEGVESRTLEGLREQTLIFCQALIAAQPCMASLVNLANLSLWAIAKHNRLDKAKEALIAVARHYQKKLDDNPKKVAERALPLTAKASAIMTHSLSATVEHTLISAKREGLVVICTESRPLYEGRLLAKNLIRAGLEVKLVMDAAAPGMVKEADLVFLGADTISTQGLINKVGSYPLALAARTQRVPLYTLCGTEKFLPAEYPLPHQRDRDPDEVWSEHPERINIINQYFDLTPLDYLTGVVTEDGVLPPSQVLTALKRSTLHPSLKSLKT
jgi:translation initiation factor eIF-2B subunit delta